MPQINIRSSLLKNRYFASTITYLSRRPFLISRLFETPSSNPLEVLIIWICISGIWKVVAIDEKIPVFLDLNNTYRPFNLMPSPEDLINVIFIFKKKSLILRKMDQLI